MKKATKGEKGENGANGADSKSPVVNVTDNGDEHTLLPLETLMVLNQQLKLKMVKTVKLQLSLQQKTQMEVRTQSL